MKMSRADRELESLIREVQTGGLDLQPDFQRGEVWRGYKQQLLIDSILRRWYVPPIHVIEHDDSKLLEVLDGQQRLRSIVNFFENEWPVYGQTEPFDDTVMSLGGKYFSELPEPIKRAFLRFTITQYTLTEFGPSEPAELFFRLNQNMPLTTAETRNAFIGPVREQVKALVDLLKELGLDRDTIGFSNSRMSYDDVIARVSIALEWGTIARKITAADLDRRYRSGTPFDAAVFDRAQNAIALFGESARFWQQRVRLNKATFFSWLWFADELLANMDLGDAPQQLGQLISLLERMRRNLEPVPLREKHRDENLLRIAAVYQDRSTSRVADVSSVVLRDAAIWLFLKATDDEARSFIESPRASSALKRKLAIAEQLFAEPVELEYRADELISSYV